MKMRKKALIWVSTVVLLIMTGCSGNNGGGNSESASPSAGSGGAKPVIKIATQSPLSGGSSVQGEAIKLGAQM
ncbi:branched-chain amino acid ABC transporter substrate-binding protein, partial [Paenibacillus sepulcri]|nr:branched-chain amino acid ABC transporter substrate-binding protein [Paenibacillus sepulcri]